MKNTKINKELPQNDGFSPIASSGDFTGLIPSGGGLDQELESYNEMYAFLPVVNPNDKNLKNRGK
jgi:hypothetical protein